MWSPSRIPGKLFALASEPKKMLEIPGANHVFSGEGESPMIEAVISWLGRVFENRGILLSENWADIFCIYFFFNDWILSDREDFSTFWNP